MRTTSVLFDACPVKLYFLVVMLLISCRTSAPLSQGDCKFSAIFNFGDSNSDTGGFWAAFPAQTGPYGMTFFKKPAGRASDGRLVIDFLAQGLGLPFLSPYLQSIGSDYRHGANFATLASTVLLPNTSLFVTGISPFSLAIQLNQLKDLRRKVLESTMFLQDHLPAQTVFSRSVYTFDIGQNDFTSNLNIFGTEEFKKIVSQVASQIAWTIKEIYDMGGRTFMVFNLAPIGCYPAFLTEFPHMGDELDTYGCIISYNNGVVEYNNLLKETLHQMQVRIPDASIIYVDTHSVKLELFQHPRDHGFLYGTKACCGYGGGVYNFDPKVYCGNTKVINGSPRTATACSDPEHYVSWDGTHATEAVNKIVTLSVLNGSLFYPAFPLSKLCNVYKIG